MADPVSVAASIIGIVSLAHELAVSLLAIKKLCEDVKDTPKGLAGVVKEIDISTRILGVVAHVYSTYRVADEILENSVSQCWSAVMNLREVVEEVRGIRKSNSLRGAWRILVRREHMSAMSQRLQKCNADLQLALTLSESLQRMSGERQMERMVAGMRDELVSQTVLIQSSQSSTTTNIVPCEDKPRANSKGNMRERLRQDSAVIRSRSRKKAILQVHLPDWICKRSWRLCFERAAGRWTLCLTASSVLPLKHTIMSALIADHLPGFINILESRAASIHNRVGLDGNTLLSFALSYGRCNMAKYLMQFDLENEVTERVFWWLRPAPGTTSDRVAFDHMQMRASLLLEACDGDTSQEIYEPWHVLSKPHTTWSAYERLIAFAEVFQVDQSIDFLTLTGELDHKLYEASLPDGQTLLHLLARKIADCSCNHRELGSVIKCGFRHSCSLLSEDCDGLTPFLRLFPVRSNHLKMDRDVAFWIDQAHKGGVDLQLYGERERAAWQKYVANPRSIDPLWLLRIDIGPTPAHWRPRYRHSADIYAESFWHWADSELQPGMPGSWEDESVNYAENLCGGVEHLPRMCAGVKRRTLRQLRREVSTHQQTEGMTSRREMIEKLFENVRCCAKDCRARATSPFERPTSLVKYGAEFRLLRLALDLPTR